VVDPKNFYGARSQRTTDVAALFDTLLETASLQHVEPKASRRQTVVAALATPGTITLPAVP
jgi:hypothetical protein